MSEPNNNSTSHRVDDDESAEPHEKISLIIGKVEEPQQVEPQSIPVQKSTCHPIPKRFILVIMCFFAMFMMYSLRVNLSVAIVSMVRQNNNSSSSSSSSNSETFDWNEKTQGLILGSFFWGYLVLQLPGGRMADSFGSKWLLGGGILGTSVLTIVSPWAANIHYSAFIVCRILEGAFEGVVLPALHSVIAKWFPTDERSTVAGVIYSGQMIGTVITMFFTAILCDWSLGGWPSVFYVFGLAGVIWFVFWVYVMHETPEDHPSITQEELQLITASKNEIASKEKPKVPWRSIFTSVPVWALVCAHFGQNWGHNTMLTQMPRYYEQVLHFDLKSNGLYSALPYLNQALVCSSMGVLCDRLYRAKRFTLGTLRKSFNSGAFIGAATCLLLVTLIGRDKFWNIILLIMALGINGMFMEGFMVTHVDMSPNFAGTLMGITNCIANFSGVFAPMVVGLILSGLVGDATGPELEEQTLRGWNYVFYLAAGIFVVTAVVFVLFGSNQVQKWNDATVQEQEEEEEGKDRDDDEKQNGQSLKA